MSRFSFWRAGRIAAVAVLAAAALFLALQVPAQQSAHAQAPWSQQAEAKCNFYYINRGNPMSVKDDPSVPPWVASSSNNMAVAEMWHYALATRTVRALGYINGAPADGIRMINAMQTYASLSLQLANVYAEGGIQYNKITALGSQQQSAAGAVQSLSASLNTPSCYSVVNTQE